MKIYLFGQALDNDNSDDWYEYQNNSLKQLTAEQDQSSVNNSIFNLTSEGKQETLNEVECYYKFSSSKCLDIIFLIDNQQKDNIGRQSKTALIIQNYKNEGLYFETILTLFWMETNRNSAISAKLARQCSQIFEIIKKKRSKSRWLVPVLFVSLSIVLVFLFQK